MPGQDLVELGARLPDGFPDAAALALEQAHPAQGLLVPPHRSLQETVRRSFTADGIAAGEVRERYAGLACDFLDEGPVVDRLAGLLVRCRDGGLNGGASRASLSAQGCLAHRSSHLASFVWPHTSRTAAVATSAICPIPSRPSFAYLQRLQVT